MCGIIGRATVRGERGEGGDELQTLICFGSYDIYNGRNGGLQSVLRGMAQYNLYLGVLLETKLIDGAFTRGSGGYSVVATYALIRHHSGVAVFYHASLFFKSRHYRS